MAIESLDNLVQALTTTSQQVFFYKPNVTIGQSYPLNTMTDTFRFSGIPSAGDAAANRTAGGTYFTSASAGSIPFTNPPLGSLTYLAGAAANCQTGGVLYLYDRLWEASGFSLNNASGSSVTQLIEIGGVPTPPALTRSTNGDGVEALLLCSSATTATVGNQNGTISLSYTNNQGTSGRTAPMRWLGVTPLTHVVGRFGMQGTDTGIQTVTGITLPPSGSNPSITGASFNLILARKILEIPINSFSNTIGLDVFNTALPKIEDNSCLFFIMQVPSLVPWPRSFESESSGQFSGLLTFTQG